MASKKIKKFLKKAAKAALIGGALYGATKLGRGRKKSVADTAATEGIKWTPGPTIPDIHNYKKKWNMPPNEVFGGGVGFKKGGKVTGIAKRGFGRALRGKK